MNREDKESPSVNYRPDTAIVERWDGEKWIEVLLHWDGEKYAEVKES